MLWDRHRMACLAYVNSNKSDALPMYLTKKTVSHKEHTDKQEQMVYSSLMQWQLQRLSLFHLSRLFVQLQLQLQLRLDLGWLEIVMLCWLELTEWLVRETKGILGLELVAQSRF